MTGGADDAVFVVTQLADLTGWADFVERACAGVAAGPGVSSDLRLATEEVVANVLQHGYGNRPGVIRVHIDATPERITVTLTDEAPIFDPADAPAPDLSADWEERRLGGLGWYLVQQVMDEARHEAGAQGGNVFTLIKELSVGPSGNRDN